MNERAWPPAGRVCRWTRSRPVHAEGRMRPRRPRRRPRARRARENRSGNDRTNHGFKRDVPHSSRSCQSACPIVWSITRFSTATASRVQCTEKDSREFVSWWSTGSMATTQANDKTWRGRATVRESLTLAARCSLLAARRRSTRWDGSAQQRRPRPLGRDIQPLFIVI